MHSPSAQERVVVKIEVPGARRGLSRFFVLHGVSRILRRSSERKTQGELHEPRLSHSGRVSPKLAGKLAERRHTVLHVETNRVGQIEGLPAEFHFAGLAYGEILGQARVDAEHAITDDFISCPRFARPAVTEGSLSGSGIRENLGTVVGHFGKLPFNERHGQTLDVPVGGPEAAIVYRGGESAGPTEYT